MSLSARALSRAMRAECETFPGMAPGMVGVEHVSRRDWASATFAGELHRLRLSLAGPESAAAADGFIAGLDDREFDLRGHFVASVALAGERRRDAAVELLVDLLVIAAD